MKYRLIVDDWGNISGQDAIFEDFDELATAIEEVCDVCNAPTPELAENPPGNEPGVYQRTSSGLRRIAVPV